MGRTKAACPPKNGQEELCFALASSRRLWIKFPPENSDNTQGMWEGVRLGRGRPQGCSTYQGG